MNKRDPSTGRPSCYHRDALQLKRVLREKYGDRGVEIRPAMCFGLCDKGPNILVESEGKQETLSEASVAAACELVDRVLSS